MSEKLKPCPFCGSDDLQSGGDDKVVGFWCRTCDAAGPNHYGRYEWNDRNPDVQALEVRIAELEDELHDAQQVPWPEWADKILKTVRSYSGYDGYDDATDGVDLVGEVEEALHELYSEAERLRAVSKVPS